MIEGCFPKHRTRHGVRVVRWLALAAACLAGCATTRREVARPPTAGLTSPSDERVVPTRRSSAEDIPMPATGGAVPTSAVEARPGGQVSPIALNLPPLPESLPPILATPPLGRVPAGSGVESAASAIDPADWAGPKLVRLDEEGRA